MLLLLTQLSLMAMDNILLFGLKILPTARNLTTELEVALTKILIHIQEVALLMMLTADQINSDQLSWLKKGTIHTISKIHSALNTAHGDNMEIKTRQWVCWTIMIVLHLDQINLSNRMVLNLDGVFINNIQLNTALLTDRDGLIK
jgi:hypothetical protein